MVFKREKNWLKTAKNFNFKIKIELFNLQYFVAVLLVAAVAQATPIEYGHYGAPALVHAPIYHAPIAKHVVEPVVIIYQNCIVAEENVKCRLFIV